MFLSLLLQYSKTIGIGCSICVPYWKLIINPLFSFMGHILRPLFRMYNEKHKKQCGKFAVGCILEKVRCQFWIKGHQNHRCGVKNIINIYRTSTGLRNRRMFSSLANFIENFSFLIAFTQCKERVRVVKLICLSVFVCTNN